MFSPNLCNNDTILYITLATGKGGFFVYFLLICAKLPAKRMRQTEKSLIIGKNS